MTCKLPIRCKSKVPLLNKLKNDRAKEKLMIMKDIASKQMDENDEREREMLKRKYLKQNLDNQTAQSLISKRHDYILTSKELDINQSLIKQLNSSNQNSRDAMQDTIIESTYVQKQLFKM